MADIEHSQIPSEYCHEPKGATEADEGEVYVADGHGSGSWGKLPITSLDTAAQAIDNAQITNINDNIVIKSEIVAAVTDGSLNELEYVEGVPTETVYKINKNFKELYDFYSKQTMIDQDVKTAITGIQNKLNDIITALKDWGLAK
jgi:hypothetical protein